VQGKAVNRQVVVAQRPRYTVPTANVFRIQAAEKPLAQDGQVLVRTTWIGLDAHLYRRIKRVTTTEPVPLGGVMVGSTVGRVEVSHHPDYREGELVHGAWGWQDWYVSDGTDLEPVPTDIPKPSYMLGALGESGFGAYIAVNELLRIQRGQSLVLGAGVGGLGQIIGQLAKMKGALIVAGAGTDEKCRYAMEEYGYDICLNRNKVGFEEKTKAAYAKNGIDNYSMTYGGKVLEWGIPYFRPGARIAVCGIMSLYGQAQLPPGPDKSMPIFDQIQVRGLEVRGLQTERWLGTPLHEQFKREMHDWLLAKKIRPLEHVVDGLENAPDMMQGLFEGRNFGKAVVRVAD
jgi:NADPH-dependent curcumin reductase CurA